MIIFMIFAPPHYLSRVKRYSQLLLCEAPKHSGVENLLHVIIVNTKLEAHCKMLPGLLVTSTMHTLITPYTINQYHQRITT